MDTENSESNQHLSHTGTSANRGEGFSNPVPGSVKARRRCKAMMSPGTANTYQVHGLSRPGGHGSIRCNTTTVKADTGSISDGFRPGPAELLCAALAACLLKNIERFSEMLPFEYEVASVTVEAKRQDSPPKIIGMVYHIEVATNEPEHRVKLLHHNIIKFGTITNTLAAAFELTGDLIAHPTAGSLTVASSG